MRPDPRTSARLLGRCLLWMAAFACLSGALRAQDFRITSVSLDAQGRAQVGHAADDQSYYVLYRGGAVDAVNTPVDLALGVAGTGQLLDPAPVTGRSAVFYRVRSIAAGQPSDLDGDGIDDVYELRHGLFLDALDAADGAADFDGDGVSNADEYRGASDPAVADALTRVTSSPASGEQAVSVNREVILRFSQPLATDALIAPAQFHADFGGRTLLGRVELAPDRKTAWLFHLEPLPASARVRVTLPQKYISSSLVSRRS